MSEVEAEVSVAAETGIKTKYRLAATSGGKNISNPKTALMKASPLSLKCANRERP